MSDPVPPTDQELSVTPPPPDSVARISVRTAVILLIYTVSFTALMAVTYFATKPAIEASAQNEKLRLIGEVLPQDTYDNRLLDDAITLPPLPALGLETATKVYRARRGGQAVALVLEAAAPDGYSGRVGLLLAVAPDGRLLAQRVTEHKETPGLGDYIDPKKDKNKQSPWITQFDGAGVDAARGDNWKVKKDGGRFDARAGATISARAVTNASGRALLWTTEHQAALFALPSGRKYEEK
jgi:electron transport complex protein RnfG